MPTAYIVECVRTACGRKKGRLSGWHPIDLGAAVLDSLVERSGIPGAAIDDVIVGCVAQSGAQSMNIGRNVVLASTRVPESVPGTTVDRQCGSSQQALHFAAQAVMSGTQDVVVAAGVESMTTCPIGSSVRDGAAAGHGMPMSAAMSKKYSAKLKSRGQAFFSQYDGAEMVAEQYELTREEMDLFALASHAKALAATQAGRFKREIVPLQGRDKAGKPVVHDTDEGIRPNATLATMRKLKTLKDMQGGGGGSGGGSGLLTAATSSQIADGAAAILVCNEAGLRRLNLKPRARIVALAVAGADPVTMLAAPIPASEKCLARAGLGISDMDLYEVNEAFASVPLAWVKALGADMERLNVNGGAMALGHPLGGTGAKLMVTLVHELERRKARYGLQAICEGGGTANAIIVERCNEIPVGAKL